MSFREKVDILFNRAYNTEAAKASPNQDILDEISNYITNIISGGYNGLTYNKYNAVCTFDNPETAPISSEAYINQGLISYNVHESNYLSTFTPVSEPPTGIAKLKMHMDSLTNQQAALTGYGSSVRLYNNTGSYSTISTQTLLEDYGDWLVFDFNLFNETMYNQSTHSFLAAYDSNDTIIENANTISLSIGNITIPIILKNPSSVSTTNGGCSSKLVYLTNCVFRPRINNYGTVYTNTFSLSNLIYMYSAGKAGISASDVTLTIYQLMDDYIHQINSSTGSKTFFIFHKDIVDDLLLDLMEITGLNIEYSGNIITPTPPVSDGLESFNITSTAPYIISPTFSPEIKSYQITTKSKSFNISATLNSDLTDPKWVIMRALPTPVSILGRGSDDISNFGITLSGNTMTFGIAVGDGSESVDSYQFSVVYNGEAPTDNQGIVGPGQDGSPSINTQYGNGYMFNDEPVWPSRGSTYGGSFLNRIYLLSSNQIAQLKDALWSMNIASLATNLFLGDKSTGSSIYGLYLYPIDLVSGKPTSQVQTPTYINIGKASFGTACGITGTLHMASPTYTPIFDFGDIYIDEEKKFYNSFLDYEPYTNFYLYLPYIGYRNIDPAKCYGYYIHLRYIIDLFNGSSKCVLTRSKQANDYQGKILYEWTCQLGVAIPFMIDDTLKNFTKDAANAALMVASAGAGAQIAGRATIGEATSAVSKAQAKVDYQSRNMGKIRGITQGTVNQSRTELFKRQQELGEVRQEVDNNAVNAMLDRARIEATQMQPGTPPSAVSGTGTSVDRYTPQSAFILIERPKTAIPIADITNNYYTIVGGPVNNMMSLNPQNVWGYTVIPEPRLVTRATIGEKMNLINQCKNGIRIARMIDGKLYY